MSIRGNAPDELDELLIEYLATLDRYQAAQAELASDAKNGFFQLVQAKLALGPARVGEAGYDLSETLPRFAVRIVSTPSTAQTDEESTATISLSLEPTLIPILDDDESTTTRTSNGLRQRHPEVPPVVDPVVDLANSIASSTLSSKSNKDDSTALDEQPKTRTPRDPIHQFAAFPPASLRTAQKSFGKTIDGVLSVVEVKLKLDDLEKRVAGVRRRILELEKK